MPYISKAQRSKLDKPLERLLIWIDGRQELQYCITALLCGQIKHVPSSQSIELVLGTLEVCKLEFYSQVAGPQMIRDQEANGDVYFDGSYDTTEQPIQSTSGTTILDPLYSGASGVAP